MHIEAEEAVGAICGRTPAVQHEPVVVLRPYIVIVAHTQNSMTATVTLFPGMTAGEIGVPDGAFQLVVPEIIEVVPIALGSQKVAEVYRLVLV